MFILFLKNIDFFWAWFTSGLDLGGWAHVCQLLQARPKSSVGTALPPQADRGVRGRGEEVEDCTWVCPADSMASSVSVFSRSDYLRGVFCFGDTKGNVIVFTSENVVNGLFNPRILPRTSKWGS